VVNVNGMGGEGGSFYSLRSLVPARINMEAYPTGLEVE
jgi:hypothetical protein